MIADLLVGLERAADSRGDVKVLSEGNILAQAPEPTRRSATPTKLTSQIILDGRRTTVSVIPDAAFGFDLSTSDKRKHFFLEADCATMPIVRSNPTQTSFARKLVTYLAGGGANNSFGRHLGLDNFRVVTVTTTPERTNSMLDALRHLTDGKGSNQFLFVDHAALLASEDLLSLVWTTGKGKRVTLLD